MRNADVQYFNRAHEQVQSATASGALYALKTVATPAFYPGGTATRRERTAWLLADPTTTKTSSSTQLCREWVDQISN